MEETSKPKNMKQKSFLFINKKNGFFELLLNDRIANHNGEFGKLMNVTTCKTKNSSKKSNDFRNRKTELYIKSNFVA